MGEERKEEEKMNYRACPDCGAHLDPQEKCDCKKEAPCGTAIPGGSKNKYVKISLTVRKENVNAES